MGQAEIKAEQVELADEIAQVIIRRRKAWRDDHGDGADYAPLEIGGLVRATNNAMIGMYTAHFRKRPSFEHMVGSIQDYVQPMVVDCAEIYDVRLVDPVVLLAHMLGACAHD
jgi:hypothetical protein